MGSVSGTIVILVNGMVEIASGALSCAFGGGMVTWGGGGGDECTVPLPDATGASCTIHISNYPVRRPCFALTQTPVGMGTLVLIGMGVIEDCRLEV